MVLLCKAVVWLIATEMGIRTAIQAFVAMVRLCFNCQNDVKDFAGSVVIHCLLYLPQ